MLTVENRPANPLTVADLAPLRRMLGSDSMVIRVNPDGSLMPFEIMPELFLGRSIRQLLLAGVRERFEEFCAEVAADGVARAFVPEGFEADDEVMITPILDDAGQRCQFLVCWARSQPTPASIDGDSVGWADLDLDQVEVRFRAIDKNRIEAAPWWAVGQEGVDLWAHHGRVSEVGLASAVMGDLVAEGIGAIADNDEVSLRVDVPSADMLSGLIQVFHGSIRASGVAADRVVVGIPVELAVDHDLLPVIVHLRTLGLQIDIVGLDALTAKLHTVSDTSDLRHALPKPEVVEFGAWTHDAAAAIADATAR